MLYLYCFFNFKGIFKFLGIDILVKIINILLWIIFKILKNINIIGIIYYIILKF